MAQIQPELDKMKADAEKLKAEQGTDVDVPLSFGQKPDDAATFKPIMIKKSKKRTLEDTKLTDLPDNQVKETDQQPENGKVNSCSK